MSAEREPTFEIWAEAFRKFAKAIKEFSLSVSERHSTEGHEVISDELTACVLSQRVRPELEGEFGPEDFPTLPHM